ncbi:FAD-dependent oxidoreductase [Rhodococcus sp. HM1]|uniref:FAD-dependent oxidoreductase n=1 Tax=Rhodococcus sp. HM1 TaxID=2937759 RepID=UPI00200AAE62|nr:FAD-dependent oxidoreductase [Rhodococcus sp. HM1]MCK8673202.1 FAD-dependent oxidoreductase [Rhodococcus sp. HM1]
MTPTTESPSGKPVRPSQRAKRKKYAMYYEWQQFDPSPVPDTAESSRVHDVAVIGGGPVGLATAIALQRRGIDAVVLEARTQLSDGSRALTLNRESLHFLDTIGVSEDFMKLAQPRSRSIVFHGSTELWRTEYETELHERFPQLALLQQCWLEHVLLDNLRARAPHAIRWGHTVTGIDDLGDKVRIDVDAHGSNYQLRARYVIGADGARGVTRRLLGLRYEDVVPRRSADARFIICDFSMDYDLPPGRRLFIGPDYAPDSVAILHSQPFDVWRLDYQVPEGTDPEAAATPETAETRVREHLSMMGIDAEPTILWVTTYRALGRTLPRYRQGRVLFAGDAAHQSPIFGGRGLNMGFGDVNALAWRLPFALAGDDTPLDEYSAERTHVVSRTLDALTPVSLFMTSADEASRTLRREVMSLLPEAPALRELIDGHAAAHISDFPVDAADSGVVGRPLSELRVTTQTGEERYLTELLPPHHFRIERLSDSSDDAGTATLLLRDEGSKSPIADTHESAATHVVIASEDAVRERLGLTAVGDALVGRPDRVVYVRDSAAVAPVDDRPHSALQRVFVELSDSMSALGVDGFRTAAARDSLRAAALEGAAS